MFIDNEKYDNTSLAHKVMYLVRHLEPLKVKARQARALLVKVETEADELRDERDVRDDDDIDHNDSDHTKAFLSF